MNNTITDLRAALFATIEELRDKDKPMDIERAKAIAEVAQTIVNSAKVEVDYLKVAGGEGTPLLKDARGEVEKPKQLPAGVLGVVTHRMKG